MNLPPSRLPRLVSIPGPLVWVFYSDLSGKWCSDGRLDGTAESGVIKCVSFAYKGVYLHDTFHNYSLLRSPFNSPPCCLSFPFLLFPFSFFFPIFQFFVFFCFFEGFWFFFRVTLVCFHLMFAIFSCFVLFYKSVGLFYSPFYFVFTIFFHSLFCIMFSLERHPFIHLYFSIIFFYYLCFIS